MTTARLRTFIAGAATYNLATMATWLQPAIITDYRTRFDQGPGAAGLIATAELMLMAVVVGLSARLFQGWRLRTMAVCGLIVSCSATSIGIGTCSTILLFASRMVTGAGYAMLLAVPTVAMAGLSRPQSCFSRMYTINLVCSSILLAMMPAITSRWPQAGGMRAYLLYALTMTPLLALMPGTLRLPGPRDMPSGPPSRARIRHLAAATSLVSMAYTAIWVFFMVLARAAGMTELSASRTAAATLIAAMCGTLLAPAAPRILGQKHTLLLAILLAGGGMIMVSSQAGPATLIIGGCITLCSYYLFIPTVMGAASALDPSGGGTTLITSHMMVLLAAGPYAGGLLMGWRGPAGLALLALACCAASLLIVGALGRAPVTERPA